METEALYDTHKDESKQLWAVGTISQIGETIFENTPTATHNRRTRGTTAAERVGLGICTRTPNLLVA